MILKIPSPVQILFLDRMLKGDRGIDGESSSSVDLTAHLTTYNHGLIHTHGNSSVLNSLTSVDGKLTVGGVSIINQVINSTEFSTFSGNVQTQVDAVEDASVLNAASHYLYTNVYGFAGWIASNRPAESAQMIAAGWVAAVYNDGGGS